MPSDSSAMVFGASAPTGRLLSVEVAGRRLRLTGRESMVALAKSMREQVDGGGQWSPVTLDCVYYSNGWNRKRPRLIATARAARSINASGADGGFPVYYGHNLDNPEFEEGVGLKTWEISEGDRLELCATLTLDHDRALRSLARGIRQRWSWGPAYTENTQLICGECGCDHVRDFCLHPLISGRTTLTLDGDPELVEISRFPIGAAKTRVLGLHLAGLGPKIQALRGSSMGAQFASLINGRIAELVAGGETSEDAVRSSLAEAAGLTAEDMAGVLEGSINCPAPAVRDAIVAAVGADAEAADAALSADGCAYDEQQTESPAEMPAESPVAATSTETYGSTMTTPGSPASLPANMVAVERGKLDSLIAGLTEMRGQNALLSAQVQQLNRAQRSSAAERRVAELVAEYRIAHDKRQQAVALASRDPEYFESIVALIPEQVGADLFRELTSASSSDPGRELEGADPAFEKTVALVAADPTLDRVQTYLKVSAELEDRRRAAEVLSIHKAS